jgi:hypothetical protein
VKCIKESSIRGDWKSKIEKLIRHEAWSSLETWRGTDSSSLWRRVIEMKVRRRRLIIELFKKQSRLKRKNQPDTDGEEKRFEKNYD